MYWKDIVIKALSADSNPPLSLFLQAEWRLSAEEHLIHGIFQ